MVAHGELFQKKRLPNPGRTGYSAGLSAAPHTQEHLLWTEAMAVPRCRVRGHLRLLASAAVLWAGWLAANPLIPQPSRQLERAW